MPQNDESKEAYEKAKAILTDNNGKPTPHYEAYMRYQAEWEKKRKVHETAYTTAQANVATLNRWGVEGKSYIDDINSAMDKWIALGYKTEIENAIKVLSAQSTPLSTIK